MKHPVTDDRIPDRKTAGGALADRLLRYRDRADVIVLALPRGGVPVAAEIASALHAPLDLMLVRKLGVPGQEELAMGAIAEGGVQVLNADVVRMIGIDQARIAEAAAAEQVELERRSRAYRDGRRLPGLSGRCVILVDDGVATGATLRAAIQAVRAQRPARLVVALPVAPPDTLRVLAGEVDEIECLLSPEPFGAISRWYHRFPQLDDQEVRELLAASAGPAGRGADDDREPPASRRAPAQPASSEALRIPVAGQVLGAVLSVPAQAHGVVVFAHGSGSGRHSPCNRQVAGMLNAAGFATLRVDLLTEEEQRLDERTRALRFDIALLSSRLIGTIDWLGGQPGAESWPVGLFGASTGAAAALNAAAARPQVSAVVSRGGRPDLAMPALASVRAPTLLIVGGLDTEVLAMNRRAAQELTCEHRLEIVPGATHLFEEPGKLDEAARLARAWFERHASSRPDSKPDRNAVDA